MKVDVAVASYNKPESLIYSLMSLKKYSEKHIDTVYIQDDCSTVAAQDYYNRKDINDYFYPWKLRIRVNEKPVRWYRVYVKNYVPKYYYGLPENFDRVKHFLKKIKHKKSLKKIYHDINDVRYQWAINSTDKNCLFIMHDDIEFYDDIVALYKKNMEPGTAIVGDLGQCWRCKFNTFCTPYKIMNNEYPKEKLSFKKWPYNTELKCRINEWCCMINIESAKRIEKEEKILFGNFDRGGDTASYWFQLAVKMGYRFFDPLPPRKYVNEGLPRFEEREKYYLHWWQGITGHSVWVNQGSGIKKYDPEIVYKRMEEIFGLSFRI